MFTDNNPLTYVLTTAKLDARSHRLVAALSNYIFSIIYNPDRNNQDTDALSRIQRSEVMEINTQTVKAVCEFISMTSVSFINLGEITRMPISCPEYKGMK